MPISRRQGCPKRGRHRPGARPQPRGWGSKIHLLTERGGKPIVCTLTAGQRHESPQVIPLLEQGLAHMWPDAVAGDKGYSAYAMRVWLEKREIEAVISTRDTEVDQAYDREMYRERPLIERAINRLNRFRRIATRYEQMASSYLAMVTVACILK